jgi:hypothetical protein
MDPELIATLCRAVDTILDASTPQHVRMQAW